MLATSPHAPVESPPLLDGWVSAVERLATFYVEGSEPVVLEALTQLEAGAEQALSVRVQFNEDFMSLCMELLEERLPPSSRATRAILMLLANLCLTDENRIMAANFGLPGACASLLQQYRDLSAETLYYVFDLVSTMTASDGHARHSMRPSIPYILAALQEHPSAFETLFGGAFLLSTLAMLDSANCDVMVQRGGLQVLVDVYRRAAETLNPRAGGVPRGGSAPSAAVKPPRPASGAASLTRQGSRVGSLQAQKHAERAQLCEGAKRWAREALLNVCRGCSLEVDLPQRMTALDFGVFGHNVSVDELKWELLAVQKTRKQRPVSAVAASSSSTLQPC